MTARAYVQRSFSKAAPFAAHGAITRKAGQWNRNCSFLQHDVSNAATALKAARMEQSAWIQSKVLKQTLRYVPSSANVSKSVRLKLEKSLADGSTPTR